MKRAQAHPSDTLPAAVPLGSLEPVLAPPPRIVGLGGTHPCTTDGRAIPWGRYSHRISYAACNEDTHSELKVFGAGRGRLFAITAGGGRALSLLDDETEELWTVDINPCQNYLMELKIAGMRALEHAPFLELMGVRPSTCRVETYRSLRGELSDAARAYFDQHHQWIADGILFQGSLERFMRLFVARATHLARPLWVDRLFRCRDLASQRRMLTSWDTRLWRLLGETLCRRSFLEVFSRDPGFWRFVPRSVPLHRTIFDRMHRYLCNHLARDNHLLSLVFYGRYINEEALPRYLHADTYETVRAALQRTRVEILTGQVADALRRAEDRFFDAYSLADVSSYLNKDACATLMREVVRTARSGARVCSRGIFVHRDLGPEAAKRIKRDHTLERRLAFDDFAMVHEFLAATVLH